MAVRVECPQLVMSSARFSLAAGSSSTTRTVRFGRLSVGVDRDFVARMPFRLVLGTFAITVRCARRVCLSVDRISYSIA